MCSLFTTSIFFVFIFVSMVPGVFLAHRITDSETSQTRQPQLFLMFIDVSFLVFQFIMLYGCRFVKSILCLTATMATMPLLPTES